MGQRRRIRSRQCVAAGSNIFRNRIRRNRVSDQEGNNWF